MLNKTITKNQYNAIMKNVFTNDYNFIYDNQLDDYFDNIDFDMFVDEVVDLQLIPVSNEIAETLLTHTNLLNKYKHTFNFQRIALAENHKYFDDLTENDCDLLTIENETLLFIFDDVYNDLSHNITVKCTTKLIYNDKRIMTCSVFCNDVTNLVPMYKFVVVAENIYKSFYSLMIFSKSINIDNKKMQTGYYLKNQRENAKKFEKITNELADIKFFYDIK